ncbi:hypothetical protein K7X08_015145 [Anisodus acutangulus]|uniref:Uncharacterized protein n=1 Tax=Anisodus acutangulus TaxID=402998 RepID=A0A9Q1L3X5_9SOLA|nr:hypothetical protein K7X08_015145 [Anisodus acutangulus]
MESDLNNAKQEEVAELKNASNSRPADIFEVPPAVLDTPIGNFLNPTDFNSYLSTLPDPTLCDFTEYVVVVVMVLIGSNCDVDTPLKLKLTSRNFACKVFAEITYKEIDMNKNEEEKIIPIGNDILQLVPVNVEKPPLWIGSPFSSFDDLVMFNIQHGLGISQCLEETFGVLSTCRYNQFINIGITCPFSGLDHADLSSVYIYFHLLNLG